MTGVLLFDGSCRFCTSSAGWLQRLAPSPAQVVPWQYADLDSLGVSAEDCAEALQWVEDGRRAAGPDAVAAYLRTSTRTRRAGGALLAAPAVRQLAWPVYGWVARHRGRMPGGTPACELPRVVTPVTGIRRRRPHDLGACVRLLRVVFLEGQYPASWPDAPRAWLSDEDVIDSWVVERLGELLGHVSICRVGRDGVSSLRWREITGRDPDDLAVVSRLFVRPRMRGQGIGTALLDVALAEVRARGLVPVLDAVTASTHAIRLFEDQGWRLLAEDTWRQQPDGLRVRCYAAPRADVPV